MGGVVRGGNVRAWGHGFEPQRPQDTRKSREKMRDLIPSTRTVRSSGWHYVLTSRSWCWRLAMVGSTLASMISYVSLLPHTQRVTRCSPIPIGWRHWSDKWRWSLKSYTPVLTTVSYIRASMRTWRVVCTVAWVDTRGMPVVMWMQTMREPRVGRRRRRWPRSVVRSRSHLMRTRK
jgi:hypothetical protein